MRGTLFPKEPVYPMYANCLKRVFDFLLSLFALVLLSPLFLVLIVLGAIKMKGNPFFVQKRPGKMNRKTGQERIFPLIKFRTMTNAKDKNGNLLPDEMRMVKYGSFLRATSLDELPELVNILIGDLAIVGPRPLLVRYLDRYTPTQRRRHEVRPGLTGYAQANGRNALSWEKKFELDVYYVDHVSMKMDLTVLFQTVRAVLKREGITGEDSVTMGEFMGSATQAENKG